MEKYGITYDETRYHPKEENLKKLAMSLEEAEAQERHEIRCPICGFLKGYVVGEKKGTVSLKCGRCKYDGSMNLAYFRRLKQYKRHVRFEPWRFYPEPDTDK